MTDYSDLKFTAQHEWVRFEPAADGAAPTATIGITSYAADKLGDVVYVDLPDAGTVIADGAIVGEIESTKSVGELFAPVDGTVVEKNPAVEDAPELVNSDPFGEGWLIRVEFTALPELLDYAAYQALLGDEESAH
ncbi:MULTISPECIES: glycine cleavage system protein GcvH [Subtercola]|uniref:Glycine cleavage system H protein n=1 Tax=Subtercola vilae TaxID=2056433 RepID=A0A4T2BZ80_9MICO|nr:MULTISPECIES: glycine cleavage system protein GcvH [Subtercola]MEA9986031.1 glycine cleavage system protein GcvH [Subtercola sp. RTI3]TIH36947.1 glycine cleavage system protein GcvH [Subtercola vilae]